MLAECRRAGGNLAGCTGPGSQAPAVGKSEEAGVTGISPTAAGSSAGEKGKTGRASCPASAAGDSCSSAIRCTVGDRREPDNQPINVLNHTAMKGDPSTAAVLQALHEAEWLQRAVSFLQKQNTTHH